MIHPIRTVTFLVVALAMLIGGLFLTAPSDAQDTPTCPAGFNVNSAGTACFQNVSTTVGVPTCDVGTLSPDETTCFDLARVVAGEGATRCPDGYSVDDSLGGQCARFTAAVRGDAVCPTGARGVAGSCYTLIAFGSPGAARCTAADAGLGGVVAGDVCVIFGTSPVPGPGVCPVSTVVQETPAGVCYRVISPASTNPTVCTSGADLGLVDGECRQSAALVPGAPVCDTGFAPVAGKCVRYTVLETPAGRCPAGSVEAADGCRLPVADTPGPLTCAVGTLDGVRCFVVSGFLVNPDAVMYICDAGVRAVVTVGSDIRVICLLGAPTSSTTVGCLTGVLTADSLRCEVPIVTVGGGVVAPLPSFTG